MVEQKKSAEQDTMNMKCSSLGLSFGLGEDSSNQRGFQASHPITYNSLKYLPKR